MLKHDPCRRLRNDRRTTERAIDRSGMTCLMWTCQWDNVKIAPCLHPPPCVCFCHVAIHFASVMYRATISHQRFLYVFAQRRGGTDNEWWLLHWPAEALLIYLYIHI